MTKHRIMAIDLSKTIFQICILLNHKVILNKAVTRPKLLMFMAQQPPSQVFMEACYSSHYWARELMNQGHQVSLIPAQHVKPFVRGNKNDHNDALAIAEASQRPHIQFVPIKTLEQQDIQCLHRIRERLITQRTRLMNQVRGLLSEYGLIAPLGANAFTQLLVRSTEDEVHQVTPCLRRQLWRIREEFEGLSDHLEEVTGELKQVAAQHPQARQLMTIPGIGAIIATALVSAIGQGNQFNHARELAVWLGLTPTQKASGTQSYLGGITKRGNGYLRKQVVHGARAALCRSRNEEDDLIRWAREVAQRRGVNKATVALANRMMRLVWVLLKTGENYKANPTQGC